MLTCIVCGRDFAPRRRDARVCSAACKQRSYRERLEAKAEADRAADLTRQREAERAAEATRKAIELAHTLIG
jgi:hypothetical protein